MSAGLARLADPKLWLGIATLIVVVVLAFHEAQRTSPGPLTTTHARLPELAGSDGCDQCHAPDVSISGACASCHEAIGAELTAKSGFHGAMDAADPSRCSLCHVEHHGDEARLVDDRAFALAGVADRSAFDHGFTAFGLVGAHVKLECSKCHRNADALDVAKGEPRFLGLTQSCRTCHEDPHGGKFDANCAACHGQTSFTELDSFEHTEAFPLAGRHAEASCDDCHAKDGPFSVETVGAADYASAARVCQDCHASPHAAPFLGAVANLRKTTMQASCQECHSSVDGSFVEGQSKMAPELHVAAGFALVDGHADLDCAKCHATEATEKRFQAKHPGGRVQRCDSCHETPHGAQFDAPKPTACAQCHSGAKWTPTSVTSASHTTFELAGAHAKAKCNDCHQQASEELPRIYRGAPRECQSCHSDAHENAFALRLKLAASEARAAGGSCALCHTSERFDAVAAERFDHSHWTNFELAGAHAKAECDACHRDSAKPDEFGRTFGRVADLFPGPVGACDSCHKDVHRGAFDEVEPAKAVPGRCASCHGVEAFRPALGSFDHATTGFAIDGAHAQASCEACHGTADAKADGRTLGFVSVARVGAPKECATCHEDVHAGAFDTRSVPADATGAVGCARCHTTSAFSDVAQAEFEHGEWTGYPLRGAHARTACEACHVPRSQPDERGRRFGRAAGNECAACHVDVHFGQFAVGGRTDCARCHDAQRPLRKVVFDHQRDSRFALDANHSKLDCSACHKPWPTADGRTAIRFKPLGTECADCHGVTGGKK